VLVAIVLFVIVLFVIVLFVIALFVIALFVIALFVIALFVIVVGQRAYGPCHRIRSVLASPIPLSLAGAPQPSDAGTPSNASCTLVSR
jgi:hypothetical protein